jgi:hypothetical protein
MFVRSPPLLLLLLLLLHTGLSTAAPNSTSINTLSVINSSSTPNPSLIQFQANEASNTKSDDKTVKVKFHNSTFAMINSNGRCIRSAIPQYAAARIMCQSDMLDIMLRGMSMALAFSGLVTYWLAFRNKSSTLAILIITTLASQALGSFLSFLPFYTGPNLYVTYIGSIGLLLLSSETGNWVLYVRTKSVINPNPKSIFQRTLLGWMILESIFIFAVYVEWARLGIMRQSGPFLKIYYYVQLVQAFTALFLSACKWSLILVVIIF